MRPESEIVMDETQEATVEHNGWMVREDGGLTSERQTGQGEAAEPATNMANDLLTQPDTESQTETAYTGGH